jgi:N-glycosylase/DNA lyase
MPIRTEIGLNWLRVSCKVDPKYRATKVRLSTRRGKMLCFDVLVALFPNILVSKARQFWVSLAKTSEGMDVKGVSFGRNAAD